MTTAAQTVFDAQPEADFASTTARRDAASSADADVRLALDAEIGHLEGEWREFERHADCTAFQSYDWISTWFRTIGVRKVTTPVVVTGRDQANRLLFILPLAIEPFGAARRLTWLASDLCDYNAPLLAPDFSRRVGAARFAALWSEILGRLQGHPDFRHDFVHFEKMPEAVGVQANPMLGLPVMRNASNAYLTELGREWESFYSGKRSSATRRRDRTKRKKLGEFGTVRYVDPATQEDLAASVETLIKQKTLQFANMGVPNIFARPGYPEFYRAIATGARDLVHVSRLDVGDTPAALNLGLRFRGCYYHVLASYTDHEMSKFGPGAAHLHDLMANAIATGCDTFDFTIGDERYKRDWCESERKLFDHVSFATLRGGAVAGPLLAARMAKRWIKQTPALWNTVSRLRALAGSLRGKPAEKSAD